MFATRTMTILVWSSGGGCWTVKVLGGKGDAGPARSVAACSVKLASFCGTPSSSRVKSGGLRPGTGLPALPVTTTSRTTNREVTWRVGMGWLESGGVWVEVDAGSDGGWAGRYKA